ncbi:hypothetical protein AOLI_G00233090 [Acnodon oligacanthus]
MRGNGVSSRALVLSALWIGCWSALVSAQCNSTQLNATTAEPCSLYNGTTTNSTTANLTQVNCSLWNVTYASSWILNAVDSITGHLQCRTANTASLPREKLSTVQKELGQIITSTINVLVQLGATPSTGDTALMTGALDTLSAENLKSVEFIQMWVCIRLLPLLPVINDTFMSEMSKKEFTCESYQEM